MNEMQQRVMNYCDHVLLHNGEPIRNYKFYNEVEQIICDSIAQKNEINRLKKLLKDQQPKKGHWIEKVDFDSNPYYECSVCGVLWTMIDGTPEDNGMEYCPRCGARLEGCTHDEL